MQVSALAFEMPPLAAASGGGADAVNRHGPPLLNRQHWKLSEKSQLEPRASVSGWPSAR
jgi:hypothetical protein